MPVSTMHTGRNRADKQRIVDVPRSRTRTVAFVPTIVATQPTQPTRVH